MEIEKPIEYVTKNFFLNKQSFQWRLKTTSKVHLFFNQCCARSSIESIEGASAFFRLKNPLKYLKLTRIKIMHNADLKNLFLFCLLNQHSQFNSSNHVTLIRTGRTGLKKIKNDSHKGKQLSQIWMPTIDSFWHFSR